MVGIVVLVARLVLIVLRASIHILVVRHVDRVGVGDIRVKPDNIDVMVVLVGSMHQSTVKLLVITFLPAITSPILTEETITLVRLVDIVPRVHAIVRIVQKEDIHLIGHQVRVVHALPVNMLRLYVPLSARIVRQGLTPLILLQLLVRDVLKVNMRKMLVCLYVPTVLVVL